MTNCPELLLHMLCDSGLSAVQPVLDTDKQTCTVAWPTHAQKVAAWHACRTTNNHDHHSTYTHSTCVPIMYAPASPPPQQCIHPGQCEGQSCPSTSFVHGRACPAGLDMRMSPHKHTGRIGYMHTSLRLGLRGMEWDCNMGRLSSSGPSESGSPGVTPGLWDPRLVQQ